MAICYNYSTKLLYCDFPLSKARRSFGDEVMDLKLRCCHVSNGNDIDVSISRALLPMTSMGNCKWQQLKLKVKTWGHQIFVTPCSSDNPGMFSSGNIWNQILPSLVKVIQIKLTYLTLFKFCLSPRFELPVKDEGGEKKSMNIVCHYCNQPGHKASSCPANPHKENFKVSGAYCTPYFVVYVKFEFESLSENN